MYPEHLLQFMPPEFDLANYEKTANMELVHWADNLIKRAAPYRFCQKNDDDFSHYKCVPESKKGFMDFVNDGLSGYEIFLQDVVENIDSGAFVDENADNFYQVMADETTYTTSIIREMNYVDLIALKEKYISNEKQELYSKIEYSALPPIQEQYYGELNEPIYSRGLTDEIEFSWLKVDMSCSDSEIKSAFNDWLKQHRAKEKKTKRRAHKLKLINRTAFSNWHQAKVLPYIDLVTWNFLLQQNVTSNILGEILFPDPRILSDKTKMIDDTTKPYADRLTSQRFIRRASKVIAEEKRKKNIKKSSAEDFS